MSTNTQPDFRCVIDKDARIAELTADLKVADRAALELAAEVARLREDIERIEIAASHGGTQVVRDIARNALKEGL
ncbi:MAG TPA: hypothetical protein VM621_10355 [Luteibacter sp.]|uniref:hypothetical protein n=1 Tax=Luteibacter sp. TaxID=1886636 RepID=UPI002C8C9BA8|nr:hypothetical protein [Luteibacter sp.]HVI55441.1 hypothetical protein [Luteibacter sp.]